MDGHSQAKLCHLTNKLQLPLPLCKLHQSDDDRLEPFFLAQGIGLLTCYPSSTIPIEELYYKFVYKDIFVKKPVNIFGEENIRMFSMQSYMLKHILQQ